MQDSKRLAGRPGPILAVPALPRPALPLLASGAALLAAFHFSLLQTLPYLRADSPVGYVPFVPLVTGLFLWRLARGVPRQVLLDREHVIEGGVALILGGIALYLVAVLPSRGSWDYWLQRYDLLALPLAIAAVVVLLFGLDVAWSLRAGLAFGFLAWPVPWTWLYNHCAAPLASFTAAGVALVLRPLPLGIGRVAGDPQTFSAGHGAGRVLITIGQSCAGTGILSAVLCFSLPVLVLCTGSGGRKALWLATGLGLAILSNLMRLLLLLAAATVSPRFALDLLHPILGAIFFGALVLGLLLALPRFGLRWTPALPAGERADWSAWSHSLGRAPLIALGVAAVLFGLSDHALTEFSWLTSSGSLPVVASTGFDQALPAAPGWSRDHLTRLDWRQLFGADSVADVYTYRRSEPELVYAQNVLTTDRDSLGTYSLENCDLFHGHAITGIERVYLGHGVTGIAVDSRTSDSEETVLYWLQAVQINGRRYYNRVALFLDGPPPPSMSLAAPRPDLLQRAAYGLLALLPGSHAAQPTASLTAGHRALASLGARLIDQELYRSVN